MNPVVIRPALEALAATLLGLRDTQVSWLPERKKFSRSRNPNAGVIAYWDWVTGNPLGEYETRYEDVAGECEATVYGAYEFTASLTVESRSQAPDQSSRYYLELARMRVWQQSAQDAIDAGCMGLVRTADFVPLDTRYDERLLSKGSVDFIFNTAPIQEAITVDYFDRVALTGSFDNDGGEPLPDPPQIDTIVDLTP